jgi:hypothetical protein
MTSSTTYCNSVKLAYDLDFRWSKSKADVRAWRVECKSSNGQNWDNFPLILLRLLTATDKQLFQWTPDYVVWRERRNNDLFRARRAADGWIFQNQEAGEARWYDCPAHVVDRLLNCGKFAAISSGQPRASNALYCNAHPIAA